MARVLSGLSLRRVAKEFEGVFALRRVDLDIGDSEAIALLGPNGAGKSTLLGVLSTLLRPTRGELVFHNSADGTLPPDRARARIGMLSHDTFLYADLTALENLRFWSRVQGIDLDAERTVSQLQRVGLHEAAWTRPVRTYSRGMRQRLGIARALMADPDLFLLDEPFTGLDPAGAQLLIELLHERAGTRTLVVCSHDLDRVADVCSRVVVLRAGRVAGDSSFSGAVELRHAYGEAVSGRSGPAPAEVGADTEAP